MGVEGIGGIFFRARDPDSLSAWYKRHLNIGAGCNVDAMGPVDEWAWLTKAGPVVFAPFKADTDFSAAVRSSMTTFRLRAIDELRNSRRRAVIAVETRA